MGDDETVNSILERLVGVRKAGRAKVVELTKQRQEMVKAQLVVLILYNLPFCSSWMEIQARVPRPPFPP